MLLKFTFKNFASFKDEVTLDLRAADIADVTEGFFEVCGEKVLPVAAIFGANASGKTNLLDAFEFMCNYVLNSYALNRMNDDKNIFNSFRTSMMIYKLNPRPFLFDNSSKNSNLLFDTVFSVDNEIYNLKFTLDRNGNVIYEELLLGEEVQTTIYCRKNADNNESCKIKTYNKEYISEEQINNITSSLMNRTLVVSIGDILNIEILNNIYSWFHDCSFAQGITMSLSIPSDFNDIEKICNDITGYIKSFDESIIGIEINTDKARQTQIFAKHRIIETQETVMLPFEQESEGTQAMFGLYFYLRPILENGGVLFVDELTASLHPLLARAIILAFKDKEVNNNHAQLIFTSHEVWFLNDDTIREDGIWFADKDKNGVSSIYSLADFEGVDGDETDYMDRYLQGRFGAVPELHSLFKDS
jgi:AAA15 family ATPase/GTPase